MANDIVVSGISLTARNTSTQTVRVNFNLSWDNSWRTTSAPFNWDAAWVFVKYKIGTTGEWKHATLATSGHTIPSGAASTQNDATGIFIYRSASVSSPGTFNPTGIQLQWNYGSDGVPNEAKIFVRVFAIEMVYHLPGGFQAGSGAINNGEFRRANDVTATAPASTFTITGTAPTVQGNNSSSSPTTIAAYNNGSMDLTGTSTANLANGYPTGFDAFYAMKYEISQQQYVDFLNTLTYTQQAARTTSTPNSNAGTGALSGSNAHRNGIDIQTPGIPSTQPAVYACNLDGDGNYNEADDGQKIACNFLSWDDVAAFLDWAALRPLTELEYEKAARGNNNPVANEFAWGNTSATGLSGLTNADQTSEIASNGSANINFNNPTINGPARVGIFATNSSSRITSGAGYYGAMELSGNLWERCVTTGNSSGRNFNGAHGNGTLNSSGAADVSGWPAAAGAGQTGGGWQSNSLNTSISGRQATSNGDNTRQSDYGGRGGRTNPTGIVTDGLVLWLDAGITSSYPESGTTWTDLSGNKNNGTLTNGPTFNSTYGGSIVFDGVNDFITTGFTRGRLGNKFSISVWYKYQGTAGRTYTAIIGGRDVGDLTEFFIGKNIGNTNIGVQDGNYLGSFIIGSNAFDGGWHNIVYTYENGTGKIYLDSVLRNTGSFTKCNDAEEILIGNEQEGAGYYFIGNISIVLFHNRSMSALEISQNFNAQKARFGL
jgi:formylglycine-generating enzyme required for sulfatase activity